MKKLNLIFLILAIVATSCKKDEVKKQIVEEKPFTVTMNVNIKENDVICIYYKDNSVGFFNEDMAIYKKIIKNDSAQTLIFELPEGVLPNDFRLDLSHENPNQTMVINKITFSNNEKSFDINKNDIDKYFAPNDAVKYNNEEKSFTFKKNEDGSYDPFLATTGQFYPLLETLVGSNVFIQKAN